MNDVITCFCGSKRAYINGAKICPHCDRLCKGNASTCSHCKTLRRYWKKR